MITIQQFKIVFKDKLDLLDLELLIANSLKKSREFVLAHPESTINKRLEEVIRKNIERRISNEPLAYILGHKEFFGLDFEVNKNVLVPRPETEQLVELVLEKLQTTKCPPARFDSARRAGETGKLKTILIDVGTGSGNIIISLAKNLKRKNIFYGIDISKKSLEIAKRNAKKNKVENKIKFLQGNLLDPILKNIFFKNKKLQTKNFYIIANLPYLSEKIFLNSSDTVKKYEPKKALLSSNKGLGHYIKLFLQLRKIKCEIPELKISFFLEISPEQKIKINKIIKNIFPVACPKFYKDLAGKWRTVEAEI